MPEQARDFSRGLLTSIIFIISIHATHTGSDDVEPKKENDHDISIHATRTGGDGLLQVAVILVSIHAARTGGDGFLVA